MSYSHSQLPRWSRGMGDAGDLAQQHRQQQQHPTSNGNWRGRGLCRMSHWEPHRTHQKQRQQHA
jgi:hypothetical protein